MKTIPLTCPCNLKVPLVKHANAYQCTDKNCIHASKENWFPLEKGVPIVLSETLCDTVCNMTMGAQYISRPLSGFNVLKNYILGESSTTVKNSKYFVSELLKGKEKAKVLVIGAGEKGAGSSLIWNNAAIEIHGVDIYKTEFVDVVCDAHYLPLEGEYYDGVWIQAVLEHVVDPGVVVDEIFRVLTEGGIVYAETPFMQQVHEGAYDFTRYTVLGHRYLFKRFEALDFGGNGGPEIVLAWAVRYLVWSITRSRKIARVFGLLATIVFRPLKYVVSKRSLFDASSGVFFIGRKISGHNLSHRDLVKLYRGQIKC